MNYETILYTVENGIATITLNRPQSLNAFTDAMLAETTAAFQQAGEDASVRCIVLTGSGRGFCSGQDLAEIRNRPPEVTIGDHLRHGYHPLIKRMVQIEKPIIGAINGVAAGAGCSLALFTDFRIASAKASFMLAFSKVGLIPDSGINWLLPRLIGQGRAYQMALTAERVPATVALEWGMINVVAAEEEFTATMQQWAQQFANGATRAYGLLNAPCGKAGNSIWRKPSNSKLICRAAPAQPPIFTKVYRRFARNVRQRFRECRCLRRNFLRWMVNKSNIAGSVRRRTRPRCWSFCTRGWAVPPLARFPREVGGSNRLCGACL